MNTRIFNLLYAFFSALVLMVVLSGLSSWTYNYPGLNRIIVMLGGHFPEGIIQAFIYFLFIFGILEIRHMIRGVRYQRTGLSMKLLPETEQYVLSADDVNSLKLKMIRMAEQHPLVLVDLIKKIGTKFRSSTSSSELMAVLSSQIKVNQAKHESELSMLSFLLNAIPSVGFIGTMLGIATSLGAAKVFLADAYSPNHSDTGALTQGIGNITDALYIAFDTTLIALVLGVVLAFFYHQLTEQIDRFHADCEEYLLENMINRIYDK